MYSNLKELFPKIAVKFFLKFRYPGQETGKRFPLLCWTSFPFLKKIKNLNKFRVSSNWKKWKALRNAKRNLWYCGTRSFFYLFQKSLSQDGETTMSGQSGDSTDEDAPLNLNVPHSTMTKSLSTPSIPAAVSPSK